MSQPQRRLPVMGGAVWHDDPCKVYCDGNRINAKTDKPAMVGGAGRLCATLAPGQTLKGGEQGEFAYDLHRYPNFAAVPADMRAVLEEGVEAKPDGHYCAILKAWRISKDAHFQQGPETERACEALCSKAGVFNRSLSAFKANICKDTACRDETW
eukprot:CAMPEP_0202908926 /NCGR_PEP_ID=MMETSP1392-20130828/47653_1 /ASSEMBLY_ACC=CAM_ASM_000868 /TAXON_ID=225041 /ORGANISM="Chlamydomonas chlamydogama, Strain SAG 11-48b" /LENGTH=154 /DNA_ID=CAMNT_0049598471 /DNA_START=211 /DNA_END=672 /DNA_ORIENTATION=-